MIDSGMQAVLAQLVVLRVVMQVHVVWMQGCLYKAGEKWALRENMYGLERTLEPGGHGAGPQRRRRYRVEESYDGSDETAVIDEVEKMMTSATYWKGRDSQPALSESGNHGYEGAGQKRSKST